MSVILAKDFWSVKGAFLTESTRVLLCITMFSFSWSLPALGCADPKPPRHGKVRRHGDKAIITCNDTSIMWKLTCQNSAWVGAAKNCSQGERYLVVLAYWLIGCRKFRGSCVGLENRNAHIYLYSSMQYTGMCIVDVFDKI